MKASLFPCVLLASLSAPPRPAMAAESPCPRPEGITLGVEPYEPMTVLQPIYDYIGRQLSARLDCPVHMVVTVSYSAEIEAMRAGRLELGLFGPFGYVMAHKIAGAEAVAALAGPKGAGSVYTASIVTRSGSGIRDLAGLRGHSIAYSDPASTSGRLLPAAALKQAGLDPDHDVMARYAGTHTAAFEAIRNGQVDAAELNSVTVIDATQVGEYRPEDYRTLWRSEPIPEGPLAVASDLPIAFRRKLVAALLSVNFTGMSGPNFAAFRKQYSGLVSINDAAYDGIRKLTLLIGVDTRSP